MSRGKTVAILVTTIITLDQVLKFWIKTHFYLEQEMILIPNWARLHFLENEGAAFGTKLSDLPLIGKLLSDQIAKPLLTIFRVFAVGFIIYYMKGLAKKKLPNGLFYSLGLVLAGALGNTIDCVFYGRYFTASNRFEQNVAEFLPQGGGYAGLLHGKVVDMFYFPIIRTTLPDWLPIWGGHPFEFFSPIFNVADSSISVGFFLLLIFYRKYFIND